MKTLLFIPFILCILNSCSVRSSSPGTHTVVSMQTIDRNGFSEIISSKERLSTYQTIDFLKPQSYQKILRVYGKDSAGRSLSKITTYHSNGQIWQYLEAVDGRAHGIYREWYPNSLLKIEAQVIEGVADVNEIAQTSWLFEGVATIFDEEGHILAKISYDKGVLQGSSLYYHPNEVLWKSIPYNGGEIDGAILVFDLRGEPMEKMLYQKGIKEGKWEGFWKEQEAMYVEEYEKGLLQNASYYNPHKEKIGEIINGKGIQVSFQEGAVFSHTAFQDGVPSGKVEIFSPSGSLVSSYFIRDGKKSGEERIYYPSKEKEPKPKLSLFWQEDALQGMVKTWYENGMMESQREMSANKKHGLSFAWFISGELMLMEEYENDILMKGSYFRKGEKSPCSKIEEGKGIVTLFDGEGHFLKKTEYEKGRPLLENSP